MAKNFENFERYIFIVQKLKTGISMADLCTAFSDSKIVEKNPEIGQSDKTLRRDFEILKSLGFQIKYNKKLDKYTFSEDTEDMESVFSDFQQIAIYHHLTQDKNNAAYLDIERKGLMRYDYFNDILKACQTKTVIKFAYNSYWDTKPFVYEVAPYMLKFFRNRWYLIGKVISKSSNAMMEKKHVGEINRFPLERTQQIEMTKQFFEADKSFDSKTFYKDSFGIMEPPKGSKAEKVVLHFESVQGKYVEKLKLHHSQQTESGKSGTMLVSLDIHITYDFVQEILHFGETVKVLAPEHLKNLVQNISAQMNSYYAEDKDVERSHLY